MCVVGSFDEAFCICEKYVSHTSDLLALEFGVFFLRRIHVSFSAGIIPTSTLPQDGSTILHSKRQGSSWDTCQAEDLHMCCSNSGNFITCGVLGCNDTLADISHSVYSLQKVFTGVYNPRYLLCIVICLLQLEVCYDFVMRNVDKLSRIS
jgi:hypothetical protein